MLVADRAPDVQLERRRCDPPAWLLPYTAAAELPALCALVRTVDLTAPYNHESQIGQEYSPGGRTTPDSLRPLVHE